MSEPKRHWSRISKVISESLIAQRAELPGWCAVSFGSGIGLYFGLAFEPDIWVYGWLLFAAGLSLVVLRATPYAFRPLLLFFALFCLGLFWAGARAQMVAAPVLDFRYYGPIEGRVVKLDRSSSGADRVMLDHVVLDRVDPEDTPFRVRVALHGKGGAAEVVPGARVIVNGHLEAPPGPAEPGGFDFRRSAWFDRLGAVGYSRTPLLLLAPAGQAPDLWIYRARRAVVEFLAQRMEAETAGIAAAILVGDRAGLDEETTQDLRDSNLAHLLAISGLHMGLLSGFVFGAVRVLFALAGSLALRTDSRKIAAFVALFAALIYLFLSGGSVATMRAFVMTAVILIAVLLDRRALSLRSVALAAGFVLVIRPDEITGPGFQMSFAATTALVFAFDMIRTHLARRSGWRHFLGSLVWSSFVAGLATAPFAAAHFNQFAHFGLVANLVSVPVMGVLVMPAAVTGLFLAPLGLEMVSFWGMATGLGWILIVADWVAELPGAVGYVKSPGAAVLPMISLGALFVILWRGGLRWFGLCPVVLALFLWSTTKRPLILVADTGSLIGLYTPEGRALSKLKGDGFAARVWAENDGLRISREVAMAMPGISRVERTSRIPTEGGDVVLVTGKTALAALNDCAGAQILISNQWDGGTRGCDFFDLKRLDETGSLAIWSTQSGLKATTARDLTGERLWNMGAVPFRQSIRAINSSE